MKKIINQRAENCRRNVKVGGIMALRDLGSSPQVEGLMFPMKTPWPLTVSSPQQPEGSCYHMSQIMMLA